MYFCISLRNRNTVYNDHGEIIQDHPRIDLLDDKVSPDAVESSKSSIIFQITIRCFYSPAEPIELFDLRI